MLKGHLPRVIYHQVYLYTKIKGFGFGVQTASGREGGRVARDEKPMSDANRRRKSACSLRACDTVSVSVSVSKPQTPTPYN